MLTFQRFNRQVKGAVMCYMHLAETARYQIFALLKAGHGVSTIAYHLSRHRSSIKMCRLSGTRGCHLMRFSNVPIADKEPPCSAARVENCFTKLKVKRFDCTIANSGNKFCFIVIRGRERCIAARCISYLCAHSASRASRRPENCQRASGGKKLR